MAEQYATWNAARITAGTITRPYWGAWAADVTLATGDLIPSTGALVVGNLTMKGSSIRMAAFAGVRTARLVAGAAGWRKQVPSQAYASTAGVKLSTVLRDVAASVGESVNVTQDRTLGDAWVREAAPGERTLRQLVGQEWWIDNLGVTQLTARAATPITTQFDVAKWDGGQGRFMVTTEDPAAWTPGRTFTAPTVPGIQTISAVTIHLENGGKTKLDVLTTGERNA